MFNQVTACSWCFVCVNFWVDCCIWLFGLFLVVRWICGRLCYIYLLVSIFNCLCDYLCILCDHTHDSMPFMLTYALFVRSCVLCASSYWALSCSCLLLNLTDGVKIDGFFTGFEAEDISTCYVVSPYKAWFYVYVSHDYMVLFVLV